MTKDLMSPGEPSRFSGQALLAVEALDEVVVLSPLDLRKLKDPVAAIKWALQHPEGFPPLVEALVPGDQVTLAVDPNLPDIDACIQGVLEELSQTQCGRICVLLGEEGLRRRAEEITERVGNGAEVIVHDPDCRDDLAYLAAGESADPIYLNRELTEADFVLPLAVSRPEGSLDANCHYGGIFPTFADRSSQIRVRQAMWSTSPEMNARALAEEAAWLLGLQMHVEVLATTEAHAAEVVAGTTSGIRRRMDAHVESSWRRSAVDGAAVVVACIDGGPSQQTWGNIARAVYAASRIAEPGGMIVVWSQLLEPPGTGLHCLGSDESFETILQELQSDHVSDGAYAEILLRVREENRLMIAAELAESELENIGIGAVDGPQSLERLIAGAPSAVVLRGAQFCGVSEQEQ